MEGTEKPNTVRDGSAVELRVISAQQGDEEALREVIGWTADYLFPAVLSMLYEARGQGRYLTETLHDGGPDAADRLRDDAWTVTHLACTRVAQNIGTFRGRNAFGRRARFSTWVYAIAQNELRTLLRSRRREIRRRDRFPDGPSTRDGDDAPPAAGGPGDDVHPSPEGAALARWETARMREALRRAPLTPEQREAVVLFHGYGYSQRRIAQWTGVRVGTVKKRVFDGLRKLRSYLEADEAAGGTEDRSGRTGPESRRTIGRGDDR